MSVHVVVESKQDALLLSALLADLKARFAIEIANGRDVARPIARQILLQLREPTALVLDTDTVDPDLVTEQLASLKYYFSWRAVEADFALIAMVPTLEVVFFDRPNTLRHRFGGRLDPTLAEAGRAAPKPVLQRLISDLGFPDILSFVQSLQKTEIKNVAEQQEIHRLRQFIFANS